MGKVTFVSIMPRPIREDMPHLRPSRYVVEPAPKGDISILVIGDGIDRVYAGEGKHVERIVPAMEIANNLIGMVSNSQLALGENAAPGLFVVDGEFSKEEIKTKFKDEITRVTSLQFGWFKKLVDDADDIWARFHQHKMITNLHRDACDALKLKREWNTNFDSVVECPACGKSLPNPNVTICAECRTIIKPKEHAEKFGQPIGAN